VSPEEAQEGIIITCSSSNRSRFKLVLFDSAGSVRYVEESTWTVDKKLTSGKVTHVCRAPRLLAVMNLGSFKILTSAFDGDGLSISITFLGSV